MLRPCHITLLLLCLLPNFIHAQVTLGQEQANNTSACTADSLHPYCSSAFTAVTDAHDSGNSQPIETTVFDPVPGHVSSVSLSSTAQPTLMYQGFNGKFLCEYQPWFSQQSGNNAHWNVGYDETNLQTTNAQASAMINVGCNVALVDFYGTNELDKASYQFNLNATGTLFTSVSNVSANLKFGILEDDKAFNGTSSGTGDTGNCNQYGSAGNYNTQDEQDTIQCIETALQNDVTWTAQHYTSGGAYWIDGRSHKPVITFFGSLCDFPAIYYQDTQPCPQASGQGISNWNQIWTYIQNWSNTTFPPGIAYVFQYGAFGRPAIQSPTGDFAWPQPAPWDGNDGTDSTGSQFWWCDGAMYQCSPYGYLYRFYQNASQDMSQHQGDIGIGVIEKGFDGTLINWGNNRVTSQQCGNVLLLTAAEPSTSGYFSKNNQIPYMQIATWNDYEEGTEIETGIDNCYSIPQPVINEQNGTINWTLNSSDLYGYASHSTIHHFTIWWGKHNSGPNDPIYVAATNIGNGQTSFLLSNLSNLPHPAPDYTIDLFVEMVGMPLILNKMSPAVSYTY